MWRWWRIGQWLGVLTAVQVIVLAAVSSATAVERRVALVVGASAYVAVPHLPNTLADATEVAAALRRLGFDVDLVTDPDRGALEAAVRRLGERGSGADAALFFFAGHGVEVGGRNWLLPVSARPKTARDLPFEALDLGLIFDQLDGAARVSLFILDACRDSPFRLQLAQGSRGVASSGMRAEQAASGWLIAYATAPGTEAADGTGPHSPFTAALLKYIEKPGLTVQQVLNAVRGEVRAATRGPQVPWESSALEGDFYFAPSSVSAPVRAAATPLPGSGLAAEDLFFKSIMETRRPEELRAFLERFPNGTYAPLVRSWAQRIAPAAGQISSTAAVTPTAIPAPAPPDLGAQLGEALRKALPRLSDQARQGLVKRFVDSPAVGRAIAVHPPTGIRAEATGSASNAAAAEYVLERCAYGAGRPCALIAQGNEIAVPDAFGAWPRNETPLLYYTGLFNPDRVPLVKPEIRSRSDVQGYRALKGPKAIALRPDALYVHTAATQHDAELGALEACLHDPARGDAACHLYAIGDGVVLPRWHNAPATPPSEPSGAAPNEVAPIVAVARLVEPGVARVVRNEYFKERTHKAIAVHLPTGLLFRWDGATSPEAAERWALEGCQIMYDGPCVLLAVDFEARTVDPRTAKPAAMERVAYAGVFRLDRVPIGMERHEAVRNYAQLPGERAIAIRPAKALVQVVSGKETREEAEREALASCDQPDDPSPCFLYASGDQVVLPRRRTEAAR